MVELLDYLKANETDSAAEPNTGKPRMPLSLKNEAPKPFELRWWAHGWTGSTWLTNTRQTLCRVRTVRSYEKAQMRRAMIKMVTISASLALSCSATSISSTPTAPVRITNDKQNGIRRQRATSRCHSPRVA
jgi:hypothetical protein